MDSSNSLQPSDSSASPTTPNPHPPEPRRTDKFGLAQAADPGLSVSPESLQKRNGSGTEPNGKANGICEQPFWATPAEATEQWQPPISGDATASERRKPSAQTLSNQTTAYTTTMSSPRPSFTPSKVATDHDQGLERPALHNVGSSELKSPQHVSTGDGLDAPRKSVQFVRQPLSSPPSEPTHSRHGSATFDTEGDIAARERRGLTLFSKLRALADPRPSHSHVRSQSGYTIGSESFLGGTPSDQPSPTSYPVTLEPAQQRQTSPAVTDWEDDADAEESDRGGRRDRPAHRQRRRYSRRAVGNVSPTTPITPKAPADRSARFGPIISPSPASPSTPRPEPVTRRATMTDVTHERRPGLSEDEGRERLGKDGVWRRGSSWVHAGRGLTYSGNRGQSQGTPEGRRPSNLRRLTGFVGASEGAEGSPTPWRQRAERTSTLSAHKWRALKAGLRMIGQRRKEENKIDHAKSAELLAELTAGTPAVLMFASMFQRDDKGHKRIPVLLEQLKIQLSHSKRVDNRSIGDRHQVFRIELEYGSGLTRMKWVIHRALRDFTNLHLRYKVQASTDRYRQLYGHEDTTKQKLPRFPRTAFPYLRGMRGMDEEDDEDDIAEDETGPSAAEGAASGTDRAERRRKRRPSLSRSRRSSRVAGSHYGDAASRAEGSDLNITTLGGTTASRKETYGERQRKKLENYLQQMIRYLIFRPDSHRLCKFLELSALGVRLAAEGSYHGKEGLMVIQSSKGMDLRRGFNLQTFRKNHTPKWFLVRHSYIVCVDGPEEMNIFDVFLVDPKFGLRTKRKSLRDQKAKDIALTATNRAAHPQHHVLRLQNSERKLKLLAKNERQMNQFEESLRFMASNTIWAKPHR